MTSNELFLSVLAMDAYNRGYGQGRDRFFGELPDGSTGESIANATIVTDSEKVFADQISSDGDLNIAQANGFYAAAYKSGNEIVVSLGLCIRSYVISDRTLQRSLLITGSGGEYE